MIFHHDGVVSEDLEQDIKFYKMLGFEEEGEVFEDPIQNIRGVFLEKDGMRVEILEPLNDQSPLRSYIKRGVKIYHHAFETRDIEAAVDFLKSEMILVSPPTHAVAFDSRIAFLMAPTGLLVELIEVDHY